MAEGADLSGNVAAYDPDELVHKYTLPKDEAIDKEYSDNLLQSDKEKPVGTGRDRVKKMTIEDSDSNKSQT